MRYVNRIGEHRSAVDYRLATIKQTLVLLVGLLALPGNTARIRSCQMTHGLHTPHSPQRLSVWASQDIASMKDQLNVDLYKCSFTEYTECKISPHAAQPIFRLYHPTW